MPCPALMHALMLHVLRIFRRFLLSRGMATHGRGMGKAHRQPGDQESQKNS